MAREQVRRWISCVGAAGVLASSCAHRPPPPLHSTHLLVQRGVRAFVQAKVAGQPIQLLLDSGAFRSILPAGFALANKLQPSRTDGMAVLQNVPVQFEGEPSAGTLVWGYSALWAACQAPARGE